jgi:hypothetical protein
MRAWITWAHMRNVTTDMRVNGHLRLAHLSDEELDEIIRREREKGNEQPSGPLNGSAPEATAGQ